MRHSFLSFFHVGSAEAFPLQITIDAVKLALEIVGRPLEDRRTILSRLLRDKDAPPPLRGSIIQPSVPTSELAGMTFHRSLYLPFIQLPREYGGHEVGEEEDDHVEGRGGRGRLAAAKRIAHEESESEEQESSDEDASDEDGEESERRLRRRKSKERAVDDVAMEEDEDMELLALCEDPILPLGADDAEDEEYQRQMLEEEELDARDMSAAKDFEQGVWDRTLEAGEAMPT